MNTAPIGWGFPEGYPLDGIGPESLPDLPFLKFLPSYKRNDAICSAIQDVPGLAKAVRVCDVKRKYSLPDSTASVILRRARGVSA